MLIVVLVLFGSLIIGVNGELIIKAIILIGKNSSPELPLSFNKYKMFRPDIPMNQVINS
jgi:hypothetical protein